MLEICRHTKPVFDEYDRNWDRWICIYVDVGHRQADSNPHWLAMHVAAMEANV